MLAMAEVVDDGEHGASVLDPGHAQLDLVLARQVQELVGIPVLVLAQLHFVAGAAAVGPGAQVGRMPLPEVLRQLGGAGEQQAEVVQRAVVLVVLGHDPGDGRLDPQVDVLGHEHHRDFRRRDFLQRQDRAEDGVVRDHRAEALARLEVAGLEAQQAGRVAAAQLQAVGLAQRHAPVQPLQPGAFHQVVEESADLARVAAGLRRALLGVVQLLDDLHRQVDVVLLELEQRGGIVHQHVGIQHVDALASGHHGFLVKGQGRAITSCGAG